MVDAITQIKNVNNGNMKKAFQLDQQTRIVEESKGSLAKNTKDSKKTHEILINNEKLPTEKLNENIEQTNLKMNKTIKMNNDNNKNPKEQNLEKSKFFDKLNLNNSESLQKLLPTASTCSNSENISKLVENYTSTTAPKSVELKIVATTFLPTSCEEKSC